MRNQYTVVWLTKTDLCLPTSHISKLMSPCYATGATSFHLHLSKLVLLLIFHKCFLV